MLAPQEGLCPNRSPVTYFHRSLYYANYNPHSMFLSFAFFFFLVFHVVSSSMLVESNLFLYLEIEKSGSIYTILFSFSIEPYPFFWSPFITKYKRTQNYRGKKKSKTQKHRMRIIISIV